MTLENVFYVLGIFTFSFWIAILIALSIMLFVVYRKIAKAKKKAEMLHLQTLAKITTFFSVFAGVMSMFGKNRGKR